MNIERIVGELERERDRINRVIELLEGTVGPARSGRRARVRKSAAARKSRNRLTPEGRKKLSDMMKKRWAERRRAKKAER